MTREDVNKQAEQYLDQLNIKAHRRHVKNAFIQGVYAGRGVKEKDMPISTKELKNFPLKLTFTFRNQDDFDFHHNLLIREKKRLELALARVTIMIDACERNDFSDLTPSMLKELEEFEKKAESQKLLEYQ